VRTLTQMRAADAYCQYLAGRHYENFSVASLILPLEIRRHLARIYAFCRTTDDLGDESGGDALPRLAQWRSQVELCFAEGADPIHPVLFALRRSIAACDLPAKPFLDLIDANVQDQTVSAYDNWEELRQYCTLSAAPVGRMVLKVFAIREPRAEQLSDDVCIGLQLANFAQDVSVDRAKGRTYLTQEDVRARGTPGAVQAMCERAARLLASGRELEEVAPGPLRIQLALYRLGGMAILSAVRRMDYRTDQGRPHLSVAAKAALIPQAIVQSGRRRGDVRIQRAV